jgi:hypothetical protein
VAVHVFRWLVKHSGTSSVVGIKGNIFASLNVAARRGRSPGAFAARSRTRARGIDFIIFVGLRNRYAATMPGRAFTG